MNNNEHVDMGDNVSTVRKDAACTVFNVKEESGEGTMTSYEVFDGVLLMYNDFHMKQCDSGFSTNQDLLCIDHCREGRIEWELNNSSYLYMKPGDLQLSTRKSHTRRFSFPLACYHGITVSIHLPKAEKSLNEAMQGFHIDVTALKQKLCSNDTPFIMRAGTQIEHIFSELYQIPEKMREIYFRIKILELLLFLSNLEVTGNEIEHSYFYKNQVDKVKAISEYLTTNLDKRYTLEVLSKQFDFPLTSMKLCFKGVYGTSIYAYMKAYRMNIAAISLSNTPKSIQDIAMEMGYDNASKFSAAFKSVIGITPLEYRKRNVQME